MPSGQSKTIKITRSKDHPHCTITGSNKSGLPFGIALAAAPGTNLDELIQFIENDVIQSGLMDDYASDLSYVNDVNPDRLAGRVIGNIEKSRLNNAHRLRFGMAALVVYEKNEKVFFSEFEIGRTHLELPQKQVLNGFGSSVLGPIGLSLSEKENKSKKILDDSQSIYKGHIVEYLMKRNGDKQFEKLKNRAKLSLEQAQADFDFLLADEIRSNEGMDAQEKKPRKEKTEFGSAFAEALIENKITHHGEVKRDDSLTLCTSLPQNNEYNQDEEIDSITNMKCHVQIPGVEEQKEICFQIAWDNMDELEKFNAIKENFSTGLEKMQELERVYLEQKTAYREMANKVYIPQNENKIKINYQQWAEKNQQKAEKSQQLCQKAQLVYNDIDQLRSNEQDNAVLTDLRNDLSLCSTVLNYFLENNINILVSHVEEAKGKVSFSEKSSGIKCLLEGVFYDVFAFFLCCFPEYKKHAQSCYDKGLTLFHYGFKPNTEEPNYKLQHMDEFSESCRNLCN